MKTILLALLVILTISCISARKHHSKSKNKKTLPTTPKAITLSNHYGTGKGRDIYQPQPARPREYHPYTGVDGEKQYVETKVPEGCDIRRASYYQICDSVFECDMCARIRQCGWCQSLNACLPNCAKAECPYTFVFDRKKCVNTITKSCNPLPNIAPEATHFINRELDNVAKQAVNFHAIGLNSITEQGVVIDHHHKRAIVTAHDKANNRVFDDWTGVSVPIYGERNKVVAYTGNGGKTVRAEDGVEMAVDPGMVKTHGINQVPDRRRKLRKLRFLKLHKH